MSKEELAIIATGRAVKPAGHGDVPWRRMFRSRSVLALCAMYGFLGYSGNFFLTLLPTYLKNHRHIDSQTAGLLTSLPFACGVSPAWRGALSDLFIRRWGAAVGPPVHRRGRPGARRRVALSPRPWADDRGRSGVLLCLTFVGNDLAMGPAWAAAADIGGRHTGVLSGAMNMMASLTAALGRRPHRPPVRSGTT